MRFFPAFLTLSLLTLSACTFPLKPKTPEQPALQPQQTFTQPVSNATLPGRDFVQYCKGAYDVDYGLCTGYVLALADLMRVQELYGYRACLGRAVRSQQLTDIVIAYTRRDSDQNHRPASLIVAEALSQAFPCLQ